MCIQARMSLGRGCRRNKETTNANYGDLGQLGSSNVNSPNVTINDLRSCLRYLPKVTYLNYLTIVQKSKQQIMILTFHSNNNTNRYNKDNSLYHNEKIKQLKDNLFKLQLEEEKMMLEIQNQAKENRKEGFSLQKVANAYRRQTQLDTRQGEAKGLNEKGVSNGGQMSSRSQQHIEEISLQSQLLAKQQSQPYYLLSQLNQFILSIDNNKPHKSTISNKRDKYQQLQKQQQQLQHKSSNKSTSTMYEQLRNFIVTKQKTIDQLFVTLTNLNNINHKDQLPPLIKEQQEAGKSNQQKVKQSQFSKFSQIDKRQRNIQNLNNGTSNNNNTNNTNNNNNITSNSNNNITNNTNNNITNNTNKRYTSFRSLFQQIQHDLTEYKQISIVKERSNQLARKLLTTSKELNLCEEGKIQMEKQLTKKIHQLQDQNKSLNRQHQQSQLTNAKLRKQIQSAQVQILSLSTKIAQLQQLSKQNANFQKYYRQTLTLQQQINILSQQNQKLLKEIQLYQQTSTQNKQKVKDIQQKPSSERKQQSQQHIKFIKESNNTTAKLLITNKAPNQNQPDNTVEEKKQPHFTHEKAIKSCSNTSLIYRELEKKNKKLSQENQKLSQQITTLQQQKRTISQQNRKTSSQMIRMLQENKTLTQQIMRISQQNNTLNQLNRLLDQKIRYNQAHTNQIVQNHLSATKQQLLTLKQSTKFLQKSNTLLLHQNKKIEQEFQYLVKQKLDIQSHLNHLEKDRVQLLIQANTIRVGFCEKIMELSEMVAELREEKDVLKNSCMQMQNLIKEGWKCVGEQVVTAIDAFIRGGESLDIQQERQQQQMQQQQKQIQQEQQQQQQINDQHQQNLNIKDQALLIEQYQNLAIQFNHCLYQLDEYKSMLNQSQIEKQLQKKYYQQDINLMKLRISKLEGQYSENDNNNSKINMRTKNEKLKINCELIAVHIGQKKEQTIIGKQLQNFQPSIQTQHLTKNHLSLSIDPQILPQYHKHSRNSIQYAEQDMITFSEWLTQLSTHPELQMQEFSQFCITHLLQPAPSFRSNQSNPNCQQQQHQPHTNQKQVTKIQVIQQQRQEKIGIFGSLYNKFSFPKLQPTQIKYELNKQTSNTENSYNDPQTMERLRKDELERQLPIQRNCIESLLLSNKNTITNGNLVISPSINSIHTQVYSSSQFSSQQPAEDEEESFDLCII